MRIWRELRPFVLPLAILIAYGILRVVFTTVAGRRGLVTPSGAVDRVVAVLGLAALVMRLVALVVVPFLVVFRIVRRLLPWRPESAAVPPERGGSAERTA